MFDLLKKTWVAHEGGVFKFLSPVNGVLLSTDQILFYVFYQFLSCLSNGCSSTLEQFRSNASSVFSLPEGTSNSEMLQLDQALFSMGIKRSQNEQVHQLLGIINGGNIFSLFPPVLFSQENPNVMTRLFRHPSLFKVTFQYLPYVLDFMINYITAGTLIGLKIEYPWIIHFFKYYTQIEST